VAGEAFYGKQVPMKLNWAEKWVVNNPTRVAEQRLEMKWFKKAMPLGPGSKIVEIGCGRGAGARLILKSFRPSLLSAQDLDIEMIARAGRYLSDREKEIVSLSVADATRIPLRGQSVDAVFGFGFLHHVPAWQNALGEIARVLKPGGFYFFEELYPALYQNFITKRMLLHPRHNRFVSQDLKTELSQVGFSVETALECKYLGILAVALKVI
jgi:ubiquinone/menaquinone biosynthesis C-methylase UbiE